MEILGVGMPELIFVIIIALLVLGPKDMQKAGRTIGKWLRSIVTSDGWKIFQQTSRELRTLPNKLIRDANEELGQIGKDLNEAAAPKWGSPVNKPVPRSQPYEAAPLIVKTPEDKVAPDAPANPEQKESESDQPNNA